jgi:hypothetical protein
MFSSEKRIEKQDFFFLSNESKPNFMVVRGMIDEENLAYFC